MNATRMDSPLENIKHKLNAFFRKYYLSMFLRGLILFAAVGGIYFLLTVAIEYFFWLPPALRTVLFWSFIAAELLLFGRFVLLPLLYLFRMRKGLDEKTASRLIGAHFPEVDDKLINLLQLSEQPEKSELLLASIAQRSEELEPIPFQKAVNLKTNVKYLKYLLIPLGIVAMVWLSGKAISFKNSYERMVDHQTAYAPPAPFEFKILNDSLTAIEGIPFRLMVTTSGNLRPEMVQLERNDELSYMQPDGKGGFEMTLQPEKEPVKFYLTANGVVNGPFTLNVLPVPSLMHFEMTLDYPGYTGKKDEILENSGNATVPEGTKVAWQVRTRNTDHVELLLPDTVKSFEKDEDLYKIYHSVYKDIPYSIASSNAFLERYEALGFHISVIKDQYPKIITREEVSAQSDLQRPVIGEISDDYGLAKLEVVYYPEQAPDEEHAVLLDRPQGNLEKFRYIFPGSIALKEGQNYLYYFRVTDNDGLRKGGKSSKSSVYSYYKLTKAALEEKQLNDQKNQIDAIDENIQQMKEQEDRLEELKDVNRQKNELNYNDQRRLKEFLERQEQQEQLMQKYTEKLQQDLRSLPGETPQTEEFNELLQERLERQQKEIEKNEQLLEELKEYTDKLDKQELEERLEELAKKQQNNKRSMEQVLELTKRYYVQTRAAHLRKSLEEQSKKQDTLATQETEGEQQIQEALNKDFKKTMEDLRELEKENKALKKPMDLGTDLGMEKQIRQEQENALENLSDPNKQNEASPAQKKAAQQLRKMAEQMQAAMSMENATTLNEDMGMLRQILDNLLKFTFDQEDIMENLNSFSSQSAQLPKKLKEQNELKTLFEHIDDSLFALSLRRPELGEVVNTNITEVYYNIGKSLERFADNQFYQGVTHQQYTLTAANNLSDFLSNMLDSMQNMMMGQGQGQGDDNSLQLPDIIRSQEELNQQMEQGVKESEKGKEGQNENTKEQNGKQGQREQGEERSQEIFEIYKQQQVLRQALEKQLKNIEGDGDRRLAEQLLRQMERSEDELLNKGYDEQTLRRMQNLKHQLMKLESAEKLQGEQSDQKSTTNRKEFTQNSSNQSPESQESYQELEILQRQVLPLREIYKEKVQRYFKGND